MELVEQAMMKGHGGKALFKGVKTRNPSTHDSDRARRIVRLASRLAKNKEAKSWLLLDEHGVHEASARDLLERTAQRAQTLGLSEAEVDEQIALRLVIDVLNAQMSLLKKGRAKARKNPTTDPKKEITRLRSKIVLHGAKRSNPTRGDVKVGDKVAYYDVNLRHDPNYQGVVEHIDKNMAMVRWNHGKQSRELLSNLIRRSSNPSKDLLHISTRNGKYYVLLVNDWVQVNEKFAKNALKGNAVKVPWSHGKLPHHKVGEIVDDKRLGLMMHNWHASMSDPIYAAGSTLFAFKRTSQASMAQALNEIRRLRSKHPRDAELKLIENNLAHRVGVRKAASAAVGAKPKSKARRSNPGKVRASTWAEVRQALLSVPNPPTNYALTVENVKQIGEHFDWQGQWQESGWAPGTKEYASLAAMIKAKPKHFLADISEFYGDDYYARPRARKSKSRKSNPGKKRTCNACSKKKNPTKASRKTKLYAVPKEKIAAVKIELHRMEGIEAKALVEAPNVWLKANQTLARWAETAPPGGAYDKTAFTITFADGEKYSGRYDLSDSNMMGANLGEHVRKYTSTVAGRYNPGNTTQAEYKAWLKALGVNQQAYAKFIDTYQLG
jgi:hypothetical protein